MVLPSLFEEQIEDEAARYDHLTGVTAESSPEAQSYFPAPADYKVGPRQYLDLVRRASGSLDIPVIASLNGTTDHGWISYAKSIEEAGAAALELNIYFIPADLSLTGHDVEQRYLDILKAVRAMVSIPVAVKLSPYFSAVGSMALALERAAPTPWFCSIASTSLISTSPGCRCWPTSTSASRMKFAYLCSGSRFSPAA